METLPYGPGIFWSGISCGRWYLSNPSDGTSCRTCRIIGHTSPVDIAWGPGGQWTAMRMRMISRWSESWMIQYGCYISSAQVWVAPWNFRRNSIWILGGIFGNLVGYFYGIWSWRTCGTPNDLINGWYESKMSCFAIDGHASQWKRRVDHTCGPR